METRMLVGVLAVTLAFACLYAGVIVASVSLRRRRAAMAAQGERFSLPGLLGWRLRNGFEFALPAARVLLRRPRVAGFADEMVMACELRGWAATGESALSVLIVAVAALALLVGVVMRNAIGAFACVACLVAVLATVVANERDKRNEAVRENIPDALESMGACFGSGFTLLQTFSQVAHEVPGPLGDTFARCAHVMEMGGSAEEALVELRRGTYASELAFVAVALDVQHQSGGTIRQVLRAATDAVKDTLSLRRSLRVQTAQAKLSARIVVVMPFILVAAFSLISPDFLTPFFTSPFGYAMLGLAVLMQVAGIVLVRRALSVDGVA
ncbi:MAG: type II secretion system F family protein [Eggerthellaceae bacterium]|nr:type II secretion system F family protein [Eggerthellaceae bacterium]